MPNLATKVQAQAVAERIKRDPVWFAETLLGHSLWSIPREILTALAQPRARVAVKGCHASSKTFGAAEAVLWAPFAGGIAITTAPTGRQVRRLVWTEIASMYPKARMALGGELLQIEFRLSPECYALGLSTNAGVNFQGFHARDGGFMLVVLDEGPGVQPDVYAAIEGVRAGGDVRVLMLGNPDVPSGPFHDAFTKNRASWRTFTIDGLTSPNLEDELNPGRHLTLEEVLALPEERVDVAPRPYLITRRFIREKWVEWGELSPLWHSKVRGEFPEQAEDALVSLAWLEAARTTDYDAQASDAWEAGIDVAGPGKDETVLVIRQGPMIRHLQAWAGPDPRGDVLAALAGYPQIEAIKVDCIGQGYYFARHLEYNGWAGKVVDVNVGLPSNTPERFANLKAELFWGLRLRLQGRALFGMTDDLTISQMASIRHRPNPRGQTEIEPKESMARRGVKSPDRAEALMLAFAPMRSEVRAGWI